MVLQSDRAIEQRNAKEQRSSRSKLRRGAKRAYYVEQHDIMDGDAKVVRTRTSGRTYHVVFFVRGEGKYVRKSLKTKHLPEALRSAREFYLDVLTRQRAKGEYREGVMRHVKGR